MTTEKSRAENEPSFESRAREANETGDVEDRVDFIAGLMERLEWERGKTGKLLTKIWGLSQSTVDGNAAEASRRVVADKDDAIRDITAGARKLFREPVQRGDAKGAKAIGDLWADVAGARAPAKQELTGKDGSPLMGPTIFVPTENDD